MISTFTAEQADAAIEQLTSLLIDSVEGGASVGFLPPLSIEDARSYWREVIAAIHSGSRVLLVASDEGRILGAVQLALETRRNGDHRAELIKLMVHSAARRRGVARLLMQAAEQAAVEHGRILLLLDTRKGSDAERLFESLGYIRFGEVPDYARSSSAQLHTTTFFYRHL